MPLERIASLKDLLLIYPFALLPTVLGVGSNSSWTHLRCKCTFPQRNSDEFAEKTRKYLPCIQMAELLSANYYQLCCPFQGKFVKIFANDSEKDPSVLRSSNKKLRSHCYTLVSTLSKWEELLPVSTVVRRFLNEWELLK